MGKGHWSALLLTAVAVVILGSEPSHATLSRQKEQGLTERFERLRIPVPKGGFFSYRHKYDKTVGGVDFSLEVEAESCIKRAEARMSEGEDFSLLTFELKKSSRFRAVAYNRKDSGWNFKVRVVHTKEGVVEVLDEVPTPLRPGMGLKAEPPEGRLLPGYVVTVTMIPAGKVAPPVPPGRID